MARKILGVLLLALALGQLSNPSGFVDILETYDVGGRTVAWVLAGTLVAVEIVGGAGLFSSGAATRRVGATAALVAAGLWTLLGTQAFVRGLALPNCGCFGVHLSQPLRWWVLVEDIEFIALAWWVRRRLPQPDVVATEEPRQVAGV